MPNKSGSDPLAIIKEGDHVQLFDGKRHPDTGAARKVMVIWRAGVEVVYFGLVDQRVLDDPRTIIRDIRVVVPLYMHQEFTPHKKPAQSDPCKDD